MAAQTRKPNVGRNRRFRQSMRVIGIISLMMLLGCGSSSDTQTAVRQAESLGLLAKITSPTNGSTILFDGSGTNDNVTFTFSVSGGVAPIGYTWNVAGGGGFQSTASGSVAADQNTGETQIVFSDVGTFQVDLTVRDAVGKTARDSIFITTSYDPNVLVIVAQITSPGQNITVNSGDSVTFSGQGLFGSESYSYGWDFAGGDPRSSNSQTETVTFSEAGTYTVNFTVTDSNGLSSTDSRLITVTAEPGTSTLRATIAFPASSQTLVAGDSVSFAGQASGGSGTYSYAWNFPGGTPASADNPNPGAVKFDTVGTHTVTLTVTDSESRIASDTVTITVAGTAVTPLSAKITSPAGPITVISVLTAGGVFLMEMRSISLDWVGGIPHGHRSPYSYSWDIEGGTPRTAAASTVDDVKFAAPGSYTVRFTVTDSTGKTATDSVVITAN